MFDNEEKQVDLSVKEQMILDFIRESLREEFPFLNLGDQSHFMETFGSTHIALNKPIFESADRFLLKQSLKQAALMTNEEMDQLGERYGKTRREGTISNGLAFFVFNDIPKEGFLIIPADYQVSSVRDQSFFVNTTLTLNEVQLSMYFDPTEFLYRVPVPMTSVNRTAEANISEGELQVGIVPLPHLVRIENESAFVNGSDRETNEQFAERLIIESYADTFGIDSGYVAFGRKFDGVKEVLPVGYGHPLMKRDIIGTYALNTAFTQTVRDVHWGTKVDLYFRGRRLETAVENLPIIELPDGSLGFELNVKPVYDIIQVRYYLYEGQLTDPNVEQSELYVTKYVLEKEEDIENEGTLGEYAFVRIFDDRVTTDHRVEVRYRYNRVIQEVWEEIYKYDGRPPTADVRPKEAIGKYVYGSMTINPINTSGLTSRDRYLIQDRIRQLFDEALLGSSMQFSDIQSAATEQAIWKEHALNLIDSIRIPATTFFVAKNPSTYAYYTLGKKQRDFLEKVRVEQPYINEWMTKYRDVLRTYDYFDFLQAMFMDDDFETRMRELEGDSDIESRAVTFLREMKQGFDESLAVKMLLPNELPAEANEYFEYGDVYLHEDKYYTTDDWKRNLTVLENIASQGETVTDYKVLLDLLGMILTLVFVYSRRDDVEGREDDLYRFLSRAFENTSYRGCIATREEG